MVGMQLPQLCVAARHRAPFTAPQHETLQTSLRSLHKMMAATRRYLHEHRLRSALGAAR
jgi:hypothetical protein